MTQTPPGWHPDPDDPTQQRYWDGTAWTEHRAPAAGAPGPASPPQQVAVAQPKRGRGCLWAFLIFLVIAAVGVVGVVVAIGFGANKVSNELNKGHDVTYIVGGTTSKADLTYTTDGATSTQQEQGVAVPWRKELHIKGNLLAVYQLSAQNAGQGTVTCEIQVDGTTVKKATSSGAGAIASCDYTKALG